MGLYRSGGGGLDAIMGDDLEFERLFDFGCSHPQKNHGIMILTIHIQIYIYSHTYTDGFRECIGMTSTTTDRYR